MTQQKQSFFEKLTGIKRVDENGDEEFIINAEGSNITQNSNSNDGFTPASFAVDDDTYEVPNKTLPQNDFASEPELEPGAMPDSSLNEQPLASKPNDDGMLNQPTESTQGGDDSEGQLTIDVYQTDDEVIIKSTIAGVKPEDLDVSINNDMVTIKGERKQEDEVSLDNYYYQECYWGLFSRSVILPVEIISDKAEATMKNGILTLKLPKADTTKTRKIQVRGF